MTDNVNLRPFSSLIDELARYSARATISELAPASAILRTHLIDLLQRPAGTSGSFLADPVFEAMFGWAPHSRCMGDLAGDLLTAELVKAMDAPSGEMADYRFARERLPYIHQVEAWQELKIEPPRSVVVTSGTGSGKTECFLVPLLDSLVRESKTKGRLTGVRGLFLYPLNALINSQRDRLRAWTAPFGGAIRFCLYNGETPNSVKSSEQNKTPEEVLSRATLRADPPPILVTNGTMLEYMLVRREDQPILNASQGLLRWIILDEAHSYVGSQAAELSLLLRRVMHAFGVDSTQVHFIATSATISDSGDRDSQRQLQQFLADVAGVDPSRVTVVEGQRAVPALDSVGQLEEGRLLDLRAIAREDESAQYRRLAINKRVRQVRQAIAERPMRLSLIAAEYFAKSREQVTATDLDQALALLDLCSSARHGDDALLPLRVHIFHRTQTGIWSCCNSSCGGRSGVLSDPTWTFGKVFLERRDPQGSPENRPVVIG